MLHQSPSTYAGAAGGPASHQSDIYTGSSLEGPGDPSSEYHFSFFLKYVNEVILLSLRQ